MKPQSFFITAFLLLISVGYASEPDLTIGQTRLGNIFFDTEPAAFDLTIPADTVAWTVTDFWGRTVASGTAGVREGKCRLVVDLKTQGFFMLTVSAGKAGQPRRQTPFAVLAPFDTRTATDSPFGIGTHFCQGYTRDIMELVRRAGFKSYRDEHHWFLTERKKGAYEFDWAYWIPSLNQSGIQPLVCALGSSSLYDGNQTPYTPEGVQAFANYSAALAKHYGAALPWIEIYNEYNCGFCKGPAGSKPENYFQMLKASFEAIKSARPETIVLGCATSCLPWEWLETVFQLGGLNYLDGVSVHPYRWDRWREEPPETLIADMERLAALIKKYNTTGKARPIWATEVGYPTVDETWKAGVDLETQAEYLVRTFIVLAGGGVEKTLWYEMGGHSFPQDGVFRGEDSFGIIHHLNNPIGGLTPKPAYVAAAVLNRVLSGYRFVDRSRKGTTSYVYRFRKDEHDLRVMWSGATDTVTLRTNAPVVLTDLMGERETLTPHDGQVTLTLGGDPVYVEGRIDDVLLGGRVVVTAPAKVPVRAPVSLTFAFKNLPESVLELEGARHVLKGGTVMTNVIACGGARSGGRYIRYRLSAGVKTFARGTVKVPITRPVVLKSGAFTKESELTFVVENNAADREFKVLEIPWQVGDQSGRRTRPVTIPPGTERAFRVRVPATQPYKILPVRVEFPFGKFEKELSYSPCRKQNITVDGKLGDWTAPAVDMNQVGTVKIKDYKGSSDLGGAFRIGWDETNFYLAADIRDDVFHQPYFKGNGATWMADGLQIALAPGGSNSAADRYECSLALTTKGPQTDFTITPIVINPDVAASAAKLAIVRTGDHTVYELAIPWSAIPPIKPADGAMRFSFLVNDSDGQGRKGFIEWGGGIGDSKSTDLYQSCIFLR